MLVEVVVIVALIIANGMFAGAEIALLATRHSRLVELAKQGRAGARAALQLRDHPERFLATVQVGITVVGATAAGVGGATIGRDLGDLLARVFGPGALADDLGLAIVVAGVSFLSIVVGELVPKSLALRSGERYALLAAPGLVALAWIAHPAVWLLTVVSNVLLRPFRDRTNFTEMRYSSDELRHLVDEATAKGAVHPRVGEIASRALGLGGLQAVDMMVPRPDVVKIAHDCSLGEVRSIVREHRRARMPVYRDGPDDVIGTVCVKDLFGSDGGPAHTIEEVIRPPTFVPEGMPAMALLQLMRSQRQPMAIVVDERGAMSGIVTLEDLLEELVGDIASETHGQAPNTIERLGDGTAIVRGRAQVRDVNRELGLRLPDQGDWTTIAGLCNALAARVPEPGERLAAPGGEVLDVVEASARQVHRVLIHPPAQGASAGA